MGRGEVVTLSERNDSLALDILQAGKTSCSDGIWPRDRDWFVERHKDAARFDCKGKTLPSITGRGTVYWISYLPIVGCFLITVVLSS